MNDHINIVTVEYEGKTWRLAQLAKHLDLPYARLYKRHKAGKPILEDGFRGTKPTTHVDKLGRECSRCKEYKTWSSYGENYSGVNKKNSACIDCIRKSYSSKRRN